MINRVDDLDEAWINFMNGGTLDLTTNKCSIKIKKCGNKDKEKEN